MACLRGWCAQLRGSMLACTCMAKEPRHCVVLAGADPVQPSGTVAHTQPETPKTPPRVHHDDDGITHLERAPKLPPKLQAGLIEAQAPRATRAKAAIEAVAPLRKLRLLQPLQLLCRAHYALFR